MISTEYVLSLYRQYSKDLRLVRRQQYWFQFWHDNMLVRRLHKKVYKPFGLNLPKLNPMLHELEGELTYLLVRDRKPKLILEVSPNTGWSTTWILRALRDNHTEGRLRSFDLHDTCTKLVPQQLAAQRWEFIQGDCRKTLNQVEEADYLFIDSDHSQQFAEWYAEAILANVRAGTTISVHDVFYASEPTPEGKVVIDWLALRRTGFWTASPSAAPDRTRAIMAERHRLGFTYCVNRRYGDHSMIFFQISDGIKA